MAKRNAPRSATDVAAYETLAARIAAHLAVTVPSTATYAGPIADAATVAIYQSLADPELAAAVARECAAALDGD